MRLGERTLGADNALRNRRLGDKECAGDLIGRQSSKQAECEGKARFGREHRMAGREDEAQQIVANLVIDCGIEIRHGHLPNFEVAAQLLVLTIQQVVTGEVVDGAALCRGHQPRARIVRNARFGPLLKSRDQSILCEVFGEPTSRTMRARPAISFAASILQTVSMVRCMSVAVTATDHTIFTFTAQVAQAPACCAACSSSSVCPATSAF